jgi:hypothetical protein
MNTWEHYDYTSDCNELHVMLTKFITLLQMMQGVHGKLRPGLPWQEQHLTRGRLSSPAN